MSTAPPLIKARSIGETLRMLQQGAFEAECTEKLNALVRSVEDTGKPGQLAIVIKFKKTGAALSVASKVTDKAPEKEPDPDMFWATVEGALSLQNPAQQNLDLRVAAVVKGEVRVVDQETGEIRQASAG